MQERWSLLDRLTGGGGPALGDVEVLGARPLNMLLEAPAPGAWHKCSHLRAVRQTKGGICGD